MTTAEWLALAKQDAPKLRSLLEAFHPANMKGKPRKSIGPITARGAEQACEDAREKIAEHYEGDTPVRQFDRALEHGDWAEVNSLLSHAWFGVPESRNCWDVEGFSEAVALLEDPPRMEDEQ